MIPYISYIDYGNRSVKCAYRSGGAWQIETVETLTLATLASSTSIVFDSSRVPHIGYDGRYNLRHAYRDGGVWNVEAMALASGHRVTTNCMALDGGGYPHFAYHDYYPYDDLRHAYKDGVGWHDELVDGGSDTGIYPSLAIDNGGRLHASYLSHYLNRMRYAYKNGIWSLETPDNTPGGDFPSITTDSLGYPHIVYRQDSGFFLRYVYRDAGGWHSEVAISPATLPGSPHGIAVDSADRPHIVYSNYAGHYELCYAYRDGDGIWHSEMADPNPVVYSLYPAVVLDEDDYPHIAYLGYEPHTYTGVLKYAYKDGGGWHLQAVDSAGDVGWLPSIALITLRRAEVHFILA